MLNTIGHMSQDQFTVFLLQCELVLVAIAGIGFALNKIVSDWFYNRRIAKRIQDMRDS